MTSSSTRSSCVRTLLRPFVRPRPPGPRPNRRVAVGSRRGRRDRAPHDRGAAGVHRVRHPTADTWLAAVQVAGIGLWLLVAPPSGVQIPIFVACVLRTRSRRRSSSRSVPVRSLPTTPVLIAALFLVPPQLVPVVAILGHDERRRRSGACPRSKPARSGRRSRRIVRRTHRTGDRVLRRGCHDAARRTGPCLRARRDRTVGVRRGSRRGSSAATGSVCPCARWSPRCCSRIRSTSC